MSFEAIQWQDDHLILLDQRKLPAEEVYLEFRQPQDVAQAITDLVVRGAPAIGITAAYACVLGAQQAPEKGTSWLREQMTILRAARPTAVNLMWALDQMQRLVDESHDDLQGRLLGLARQIHAEDIAANRAMGAFGAGLLGRDVSVLTHCNTGSLATGGYGTALGVIRTAYRNGQLKKVFASETRPWLQGARLTAWELTKDQIPVDLVIEGAVGHLFRQQLADWLIVGSDRITANGDVANKIGTYAAAVQARHHGAKVMVVAPQSTVDLSSPDGNAVEIEMRENSEILNIAGSRVAAEDASAWNPVFDITPNELVDAIVTEKGVALPPFTESLAAQFQA